MIFEMKNGSRDIHIQQHSNGEYGIVFDLKVYSPNEVLNILEKAKQRIIKATKPV